MPLIKNPSPQAFSSNVAAERNSGRPRAQALAIAYDIQRRAQAGKYAQGGRPDGDAPSGMTGKEMPRDFRNRIINMMGVGLAGMRTWDNRNNQLNKMDHEWEYPETYPEDRQEAIALTQPLYDHMHEENKRRLESKPDWYNPKPAWRSQQLPDIPQRYASGGMPGYGFIHGANPGRSDTVPASVRPKSYVIPADVVSGFGQGNSLAGAKRLDLMFGQGPYGTSQVKMHQAKPTPHPMPKFAYGGQGDGVEIKVSDGEYLVHPESIQRLFGDAEYGHKVLDNFVIHARKKAIEHLSNLPPPKGSDAEFEDGGTPDDANFQQVVDLPPLPDPARDQAVRDRNETASISRGYGPMAGQFGVGVTPPYARRLMGLRR